MFKISPDATLKIVQELYEKKLVTYPRTDARVLSTAVSKEIQKNLGGLKNLQLFNSDVKWIFDKKSYQTIAKTRYVNDKQITDHYAIIPTGQGLQNLNGLPDLSKKVYYLIVRRFLSIFYPPAVYQKITVVTKLKTECFFSNFKVLIEEGFLKIAEQKDISSEKGRLKTEIEGEAGLQLLADINKLKKGMKLPIYAFIIKEGETAPPKRYNSGSMILAMENAGQLIEDEELRTQIKGSGIGTSATRAEILNKLVKIEYLNLNKKTQVITPTLNGELIYEIVNSSIRSLLNAELTASWEKGLTYVAEGTITKEEYLQKLESFIKKLTLGIKHLYNQNSLEQKFQSAEINYKKK